MSQNFDLPIYHPPLLIAILVILTLTITKIISINKFLFLAGT